jgi:hypothetical protein
MSTDISLGHTSAGHGVVFFIAMLATALALGGALAHAFELPNKMDLSREEYFIVQKAYRGWNQLAYLLVVQLLSLLALAYLSWRSPAVFWMAALALLCLAGAQAVFWIYTYPANAVTQNWTVQPDNWEALRRQWEYSHLAGAIFQLIAMIALIIGALSRPPLAS